jgi:hypothetical protein
LPFSHGQTVFTPQDAQKKLQSSVSPQEGRVRWMNSDIIILISAKQFEKNMYSTDDVIKRTKSAIEKWKAIAAQYQKNGLNCNTTQC